MTGEMKKSESSYGWRGIGNEHRAPLSSKPHLAPRGEERPAVLVIWSVL